MCRVVVDVPHRRHHTGNQYQVRLDIIVPGDEIAVSREAPEHDTARDFAAAVSEAFDTAERQLEDYVRKRREQGSHW
jgi:ribosome-associated translation inhibitor RaiA